VHALKLQSFKPTSVLSFKLRLCFTSYPFFSVFHPKPCTSGDPKITGIIFLEWLIRFYTITTLSLLQSTLLLTRYTCTNVFPTYAFTFVAMLSTISAHLIVFRLITLTIFGVAYKSRCSALCFPTLLSLLPRRPKYRLQHPVLHRPQCVFFTHCDVTSFISLQNNKQNSFVHKSVGHQQIAPVFGYRTPTYYGYNM